MEAFIVHGVPGSPFGRSVLMALEEKGAGYRLAPVVPGTLRSDPHRSRHPFGKVPVLDHGGFLLYESQAILRYLDRVLPTPVLTPATPQAAARMDQMLNINDWYLFQGVGRVIGFQRIVGPKLLGLLPDEAAIAAAMPQAHAVFEELARLLGDREFLTGHALSLADLAVAPQLEILSATPEWEPLIENHEHLRDWLARMNARASMAATTWARVAEMAKCG